MDYILICTTTAIQNYTYRDTGFIHITLLCHPPPVNQKTSGEINTRPWRKSNDTFPVKSQQDDMWH